MYCVLANRNLFSQVGLLSECPYAGIEAEEFASRMKKKDSNKESVEQVGSIIKAELHCQDLIIMKKLQKELQDVKEDFEKFLAKA
jgi:hypothetical protein